MAIKNWTVKIKQIKKRKNGLLTHFIYLFDENRAAHYYSHIIDLNNSPQKLSNIIHEYTQRKERRKQLKLRGGGVSNLATSFVLSLPRDIRQPTNKEEWQRITKITLQELSEKIDIPFDKIKANTIAVTHDESLSHDKPSHIHILVGNIIDGEVKKAISQFQAANAMKNGFNKAVKRVLNEDNLKYIPKKTKVGDKPLFVARAEKAEERERQIEIRENKLKSTAEPQETGFELDYQTQEKRILEEIRAEINAPQCKPEPTEIPKKKKRPGYR